MKFVMLGAIPKESECFSVDFQSPIRKGKNFDDWKYRFSMALPKNEDLQISGKFEIYDKQDNILFKDDFDPSTSSKSSWLQSATQEGWLVGDSVNLEEGSDYKIKLIFDNPTGQDIDLYLHYNTHL